MINTKYEFTITSVKNSTSIFFEVNKDIFNDT